MAESLLMLGILWGTHALVGGLPALIARAFAPDSLHWREWEMSFFVVPFWLLILSQWVYPTGGLSNWLIELGLLTGILFGCIFIRVVVPSFGIRPRRAGALLTISCIAAVVIHAAVPALPD